MAAWIDSDSGGGQNGPLDAFELTQASAAPAYDTEEQQNIAVYKKALPSVVNITSTAVAFDFFYGPVPQQGQGSGFILNKDGLILTNNHVIDNAQRVEVKLSDKQKYKAQVLGVDKNHDLALLKINAPNLVPATLAESQRSGGGAAGVCDRQSVWAVGHDDARDHLGDTVDPRAAGESDRGCDSDGCVGESGQLGRAAAELARRGDRDYDDDCEQWRGPVVRALGLRFRSTRRRLCWTDLQKYGRVRRPSLDIQTLPIGPDIAEQIGLPADYGMLIERVFPGGAAEKAGLHGGHAAGV